MLFPLRKCCTKSILRHVSLLKFWLGFLGPNINVIQGLRSIPDFKVTEEDAIALAKTATI